MSEEVKWQEYLGEIVQKQFDVLVMCGCRRTLDTWCAAAESVCRSLWSNASITCVYAARYDSMKLYEFFGRCGERQFSLNVPFPKFD